MKIKINLTGLVLVSLIISLFFVFTGTANSKTSVMLLDKRARFKETPTETVKVNDHSYLLLKELCLFYRIGFIYDPVTKGVTLKKEKKVITLNPGSKEFHIGKKKITFESPPVIVNSKMAVPPRGMASILEELLGCPVTWRETKKTFSVNDEEGVTFWEDHPEKTAQKKKRNFIQAGDVLSISVWQKGSFELDELTREREVQEDGTITFPFIGKILTSELTPSRLEAKLAGKLKGYIKNPEVTVRIKGKRTAYKVQIFGAVRKPGTYEFTERVTLMEAVNKAGGFHDNAKLTKVRITRFIHHSPYKTDIVNCKLILYEGQRQFDVSVEDRDIIYVPQKKGLLGGLIDPELLKHALVTAVTILVGILMRG